MENLNLVLLSGGYYHCTSLWNAEPFGKENCYKIYFPVDGSSRIFSGGQWYDLKSGNIYFINGFMLDKYNCDDFMDVYWLHFIPESQFLSIYINNLRPVFSWGHDSFPNMNFKKIPLLFDEPYSKENRLLEVSSLSLNCYINSIVLLLLSDMSEKQNTGSSNISYDLYLKLEPAINFINDNYDKNLKLDDIAQKTFLNPIYFLRQFKKCFSMTPNNYLNMIRLKEACRLLIKTDIPVKEIAEKTGFSNQFYFSKVFKSHYHKTPLEYRNTKLSP
jgi:AraC-type DNA-binding domain-containing proteins